jgi:fructuronate reductase
VTAELLNRSAQNRSAQNSSALSRAALSRSTGVAVQTPPARIVHVGLGAFHRAHQVWYTAAANDAGGTARWGIASFTGRSPALAHRLAQQDGLYTLIERSDAGDSVNVISSLVEAIDGANLHRFSELVAAPTTALVTMTVTELGYRLTSSAQPDPDDPAVVADIARLRASHGYPALRATVSGGPTTALGRLLAGLEARRRADAGPIAVVPCDNIPDNGTFVGVGLSALAERVNPNLAVWMAESVSFVSTSVDRITPRSTPNDVRVAARLSGWADSAPVVTEPFTDWVLSGDFPAGRPEWENAGARFVDDIEPFEQRKLWLLNGAHSLLAYAGLLRGHETVAAAIADPVCIEWVTELWDEAAPHLPAELLGVEAYRTALLERFGNARIEHRLSQIAQQPVTKLRVRIAAVARLELAAGRSAPSCALAIGAWIALLLAGVELPDAQSAAVHAELSGARLGLERRLLALLDRELATDAAFTASVAAAAASLSRHTTHGTKE